MTDNETKVCPFCAEEIKTAAIKCKHCGEMLDATVSDLEPTPGTLVPQCSLCMYQPTSFIDSNRHRSAAHSGAPKPTALPPKLDPNKKTKKQKICMSPLAWWESSPP